MIDAWQYRMGDPADMDKNFKNDKINRKNMAYARKNVAPFGTRVKLMKNLSAEGAGAFDDDYFDWVYVDALHTAAALENDLMAWYPKVRNGGLVSGDDFGDVMDTATIDTKRWENSFGLN